MTAVYDPANHYNRVTAAWQLLLGDELHYGVFHTGREPLALATAQLTDLMIAAAEISRGQSVLDVGCGTGAPACRLAQTFRANIVGITTSEVGLDAARDRADVAGLSDLVRFQLGDGMNNGLPDASFDRVWVLESSHLMRNLALLLSECSRVLKPGGRLALCDIVRRRDIPFSEVRERRAEFAILREAFGDAHMAPLGDHRQLAEASGLVVDHYDDLTLETLPTFDRWRRNAAAHSAEVTKVLGTEGIAAFVRSSELLEELWNDGTFGYGLMAAAKPVPDDLE